MWITLLVMAVAVSLEPFRIGMSVVMLNRPRPHLQLAAFLCGGFLMGLSVGAVVLFALESRLLASAHFTFAHGADRHRRAGPAGGGDRGSHHRPRTPPPVWLSPTARRPVLVGSRNGPASVLRCPRSTISRRWPSSPPAAFSPPHRLSALLVFNLVAFALVKSRCWPAWWPRGGRSPR